MAAAGVTWMQLTGALQAASVRQAAGTAVRDNREMRVEAGPLFRSAEEVGRVVVAVRPGRPVYVSEVARVVDGPGRADRRRLLLPGPVGGHGRRSRRQRVPRGDDRPRQAHRAPTPPRSPSAVLKQGRGPAARGSCPPTSTWTSPATTARPREEKSNELVEHLLIATLSVVALISLAMGWRSGLVVGIAVPVTLALTLFIYFLAGYTLNRVTLFALIFSIGILVDDAIVVVENIERHHREKKGLPFLRIAVEAVDEVGNPTILATFTVIAAILPMAFVRGLMGPYMRPIPTGASAAMLFSLAVAFIVSPWAAYRIFRHDHAGDGPRREAARAGPTRLYRRVMTSLVTRPSARWAFFAVVVASSWPRPWAWWASALVKVKMLPFDNKSEFQVLVDHDAGTPLEVTLRDGAADERPPGHGPRGRATCRSTRAPPRPFNFNGLVRHYFLRRSPHGADLQVNLVGKHDRDAQSHDIAKRVRPALVEIANERGARGSRWSRSRPGRRCSTRWWPRSTARRRGRARTWRRPVRGLFETTPGRRGRGRLAGGRARARGLVSVDREKAGLKGIPAAAAVETAGRARRRPRRGPPRRTRARASRCRSRVRLSAADRASLERRLSLRVDSPLGGAGRPRRARPRRARAEPQPIVHKDLKPVVYVFGDLAGERESPVYALAGPQREARRPEAARRERRSSGTAIEAPETSRPARP